ncbi:adenosylcobinamide-GDP ribazoletransferase [Facklamia lactis]|nr:adenosylcobinamide-GDP ribazoletransferase [Facklamia lactis]
MIILCFQFFTQIPINYLVEEPDKQFKEGIVFFSFYGILYGSLLAFFWFVLSHMLDAYLTWGLVMVFDVILTNAFHYDALADTFDGLLSGRKPDKMLEIMKDSLIGSNGTVVLICYFLLTYLFGQAFIDRHVNDWMLPLVWAATGRSLLTLTFFNLHYVGKNPAGLGSLFEGIKPNQIVICQLFYLLFLSLLNLKWFLAYVMSMGMIFLYRRYVYRKIGGMTGDTMGASVLIGQVIFLIMVEILS